MDLSKQELVYLKDAVKRELGYHWGETHIRNTTGINDDYVAEHKQAALDLEKLWDKLDTQYWVEERASWRLEL